jgi:UDP-glucose 4-epimerase
LGHYLVTGGAGFIGSHLVEHLLKEGHQVRVVDNLSSGRRENLQPFLDDIDLREIDIRDYPAVAKAMMGIEYVFHEAALVSVPLSIEQPVANYEINVTGTLNILIAAQQVGIKRVVFAGSSAAYGDSPEPFKTEGMAPRAKSPYAAAKVAAESFCQAYNAVYDLETTVVRYFNVFGPRQDPQSPYAAVIPIFASAMLAGKQPVIFGDGQQTRDFTYVGDVVRGNMLAMHSSEAAGEVFNIASGKSVNLLELVSHLNTVLGTNVEPRFAPPRAGDILHSCADISKARQVLRYEPLTSFAEGLEQTLNWYRQYLQQ